ncbi:DUF5675 family protein [Glaciecola siphonariae]|uniref:DUF5675 family protein n=1 Tax=Glaciecola siphonariae TaxID=521012 RepID=A0ABV9LTU0_9ALTE
MQILYRRQYEKYCLGTMILPDAKEIYILERPWIDNVPFISCIPSGNYIAKPDDSGRFRYYELQNVPGRTHIEIHPANKVEQLEGCLAPCMNFDRRTITAIESRKACELLKKWFGNFEWHLKIINVNTGE